MNKKINSINEQNATSIQHICLHLKSITLRAFNSHRNGICFGVLVAFIIMLQVTNTTHANTPFTHQSTFRTKLFASIDYDKNSQMLTLQFHSGYTYRYYNVPAIVFTELKKTKTQGQYFNDHIRRRYICRRMDNLNSHQQSFDRIYGRNRQSHCPYQEKNWTTCPPTHPTHLSHKHTKK